MIFPHHILPASLVLASFALSSIHADETPKPVGVEIELLANVSAIEAGSPFLAGIRIVHEPGFHTYWKAPGIVGLPTSIKWNLPEGFHAGELQWPAPEVVLMLQYKAYGYRDQTLLFAEITPPDKLPDNQPIHIAANISWMACTRTCNPGNLTLKHELPLASPSHPPQPANAALFTSAANSVPQNLAIDKRNATTTHDSLVLNFSLPTKPTPNPNTLSFIPEQNFYNPNSPQSILISPSGEFTLTIPVMPLSQGKLPATISGLLHNPDGWPQLNGSHFARLSFPVNTPPN